MLYIMAVAFGALFSAFVILSINLYDLKKRNENITPQTLCIPKGKKAKLYALLIFVVVVSVGGWLVWRQPEEPFVNCLRQQFLISLLSFFCYTDLKYRLVPNHMILIGLAVRAVFLLAEFIWCRDQIWDVLKQLGLGILVIGGFFILCAIISKNGFGMGDVKLFIMMASYLGLTGALPAIGTSFVLCFLVAIILIALRKKTRKDYLPLVPFVLAGTLLSTVLISY